MTWEKVIGGIDFGEGPRWHDGRLWFSDFHPGTINSVGPAGDARVELTPGPRPSGLGWLPDGRLLYVSMLDRTLMRVEEDGTLTEHADLSGLTDQYCNDMVVSTSGVAYVGNFGFDLEANAKRATTGMIVVLPDGTATMDDREVLFPNGSIITADGSTLIVGETFGHRYSAFEILADGMLGEQRVWADVPGTYPDGCTSDAEGAIWFSDAVGRQVLRVREGGEITHRLETPENTFACMLGGEDGRTLYMLTSIGGEEAVGTGTGALWTTRVDVPKDPHALP